MKRRLAIGVQDFERIIEEDRFYVDKTEFIREWWNAGDEVTLITRPRRFGKTLTLSMMKCFFSVEYANRNLFEKLAIWKEEKFRNLQGTFPVISLSFADVKENTFANVREHIFDLIADLYEEYAFIWTGAPIKGEKKRFLERDYEGISDVELSLSLKSLAKELKHYYGKKVLIFLDEYDTPMQEAYVHGFWEELSALMRTLFNSTFKTNPYLHRGLMTGITRVSRESFFSDLYHLNVCTTTSARYADVFGFTKEEVLSALEEHELSDRMEEVKFWYDGFRFGETAEIYNPWSILNFLDEKKAKPYWINTGGHALISKLIWEGDKKLQENFKNLLFGGTVQSTIEEQLVYSSLDVDEDAIWSLLLASGYLKVQRQVSMSTGWDTSQPVYEMALTNHEVILCFKRMVVGWFARERHSYNAFIEALLEDDLEAMNEYMNRVALRTLGFSDSGSRPSIYTEPERFYHGFVLGMMVELDGRYVITSNRQSGLGRYDVLMEPLQKGDNGIIFEFKVLNPKREESLEETVQAALKQIEEKKYEQVLLDKGIERARIKKYGFAFCGQEVLIG